MTLEELNLFLTLAKTLHFQRASMQSNISPSAFSRAIQRIENEVGCSLFERTNRTVRLTPEGKRFHDYAEQIQGLWREGKQALKSDKAIISGELSIYCSVTAAFGILPDVLNGFRKNYPGVHIKLHTGDAESALEQIQSGNADIAIAAVPDTLPDPIHFMFITEIPLIWIKSATQPEASNQKASTPQASKNDINWESTPLILPKQGIARRRFDKWCRQMKLHPNIYAQVTGNEAIIAMVHLGCGIGLIPEMVLENSPSNFNIIKIETSQHLKPYTVGICINEKKLTNPVILAFKETAQMFYSPLKNIYNPNGY